MLQCARNYRRRVYIISANDLIHASPVDSAERAHILALDPRLRGDLPDTLEIFVGMLCIITENAHTSLGVANGSRGVFVGICFDPREPHIETESVS